VAECRPGYSAEIGDVGIQRKGLKIKLEALRFFYEGSISFSTSELHMLVVSSLCCSLLS